MKRSLRHWRVRSVRCSGRVESGRQSVGGTSAPQRARLGLSRSGAAFPSIQRRQPLIVGVAHRLAGQALMCDDDVHATPCRNEFRRPRWRGSWSPTGAPIATTSAFLLEEFAKGPDAYAQADLLHSDPNRGHSSRSFSPPRAPSCQSVRSRRSASQRSPWEPRASQRAGRHALTRWRS